MATLTQTDSLLSASEKRKRSTTFVALRNPNFRVYFAGQLVSISGTWMQSIAQGFLVFSLTKSEFWLGLAACAGGLPMLFLSPFAGVVVERIPRRTLMMITQTIQMVLAFILAAMTFTGTIQVWHIIILAFLLGLTNAFDTPARMTLVVEVTGREHMQSGIALSSLLNSAGRVLGPMTAALVLARFDAAFCFLLNGVSFIFVLMSLYFMKVPYAKTQVNKTPAIIQLKEGLSYARSNMMIWPLLLLTGLVGFFFVPVMQIMAAFADVILHSPKEAYAAMSTALGVGSVIAGMAVSRLSGRLGYGRLIGVATGFSAIATIIFAMQTSIPLATGMSIFMGLFLVLQMLSLNTTVQMSVTDQFRGRVLSLYSLALLGFAPFGALVLGGLATAIGTGQAIAAYGVVGGLLSGFVVWRWPHIIS